jgi:pimeloyl-ACP methyl ester carboxylesterase
VEEGDTRANGIRLHYLSEGAGDLVILLHGFPQTHHAWHKQIGALGQRFRVVAPDMRGYGESEKPPGVGSYGAETLADDVAGLVHTFGATRAHIVGHDWGGAVAWYTALLRPEVVDRLVVLNSPHPAIMAKALRSNWRQLRRSWYILGFQIPWLPEQLLLRNGARAIADVMRQAARSPETFAPDDLDLYRRAFRRPGAATATINYYRAAIRGGRPAWWRRQITAPTMLIWGQDDFALGNELTLGTDGLVRDLRIENIPGAGHFVMEERPDLVNRLLLEFLAG